MILADAPQQLLLPPNLNQPLTLQNFAAMDAFDQACQTRSCRLTLTHQQPNVGHKIKSTLQGGGKVLEGALAATFWEKNAGTGTAFWDDISSDRKRGIAGESLGEFDAGLPWALTLRRGGLDLMGVIVVLRMTRF